MSLRGAIVEAGRVANVLVADAEAELVPFGAIPCPPETAIGWRYDEADGTFAPPPAEPVDLVAYAAAVRYRWETAGIVFGQAIIRTDLESQARITGAWALAREEPSEPVDFKSEVGWVQIDSATMISIALAVGRHVRGLFRLEREIAADIAAGRIATPAAIDARFAAFEAA